MFIFLIFAFGLFTFYIKLTIEIKLIIKILIKIKDILIVEILKNDLVLS